MPENCKSCEYYSLLFMVGHFCKKGNFILGSAYNSPEDNIKNVNNSIHRNCPLIKEK